jgi:PEP-CTERM motif
MKLQQLTRGASAQIYQALCVWLVATSFGWAGIVVFEANSTSPAGLTAIRSSFFAQGNLLAPPGQTVQDVDWDGLPLGSNVAGSAFNSRGIQFSTPGTGFLVDDDFGFPSDLQTFSPGNLFAQVNSNIVDFTFVVPGTNTATNTSAFGAVFVDLENANETRIDFFDQNNSLFFSHNVLNGTNRSLTFFGGVANAGEQISRVRITFPNNFVTSNGNRANEVDDFVVLDNVSFAGITAVPEPSSMWLLGLAGLSLVAYRRLTHK